MKRRQKSISQFVHMLPDIRKIQLFRSGNCVGSIYRWHGRLKVRGLFKTCDGDIARIFYANGTIQNVKQKRRTVGIPTL